MPHRSECAAPRAIEASLAPGVVSEVARRHGISPQQLFAWRREARRRFEASTDAPPFVPAVVEAADGERISLQAAPSERAISRPHSIELDIDGTSVWIWRDANAAMVTARRSSASPRCMRSRRTFAVAIRRNAAPLGRSARAQSSPTSSRGCAPSSRSSARRASSPRRSAMRCRVSKA